jgi:hypothetical protein
MMNKSNVLFVIGIVLLLVSLAVDSYIYFDIVRPEVTVGLIGDIPWSTLVLGIILTVLGYWKKSS